MISVGAPTKLLIASQKASIDEIHHAQISYRLSSEFMKESFSPGTLSIKGSLESGNIEQMIKSTIHEGCIEETVSAVEAHHNARMAKTKDIKDFIFKIATDETNHAQLAWDSMKWVIDRYPQKQGYVKEIFESQLNDQLLTATKIHAKSNSSRCLISEEQDEFHGYGVSETPTRMKIKTATIAKIIEPMHISNLQDIENVSKFIPALNI